MENKIKFEINYRKTIAAILYVISKMSGKINKYNLMKVMFCADKYHLNSYARPITGDVYIKMQYGTVPSAILNMIDGKDSDYYLNELKMDNYPFRIEIGEKNSKIKLVKSEILPNMDLLSESDIEALDEAIKEYGTLSFDEVKEKNHKEKCWNLPEMNTYISFDLMIENEEIKSYLKENSKNIVIQ